MHFLPVFINCTTNIGKYDYDGDSAAYLLRLQDVPTKGDHRKTAEMVARSAIVESGMLSSYETAGEALDPFYDTKIRVYTDLVTYFEFFVRDFIQGIYTEWEEDAKDWDQMNREYYQSVSGY